MNEKPIKSMTFILPKREDCGTCKHGEYYSHSYIKCKLTGNLEPWRFKCDDYLRMGKSIDSDIKRKEGRRKNHEFT